MLCDNHVVLPSRYVTVILCEPTFSTILLWNCRILGQLHCVTSRYVVVMVTLPRSTHESRLRIQIFPRVFDNQQNISRHVFGDRQRSFMEQNGYFSFNGRKSVGTSSRPAAFESFHG
jgi:hypothetical protein